MANTTAPTPLDSLNLPASSLLQPGAGATQLKYPRGGNKMTSDTSVDSLAMAVTNEDGWKTTYSAISTNFVPVTGATHIFTVTGSATKVVRIIHIEFSMALTTAIPINVSLLMLSSALTGGTPTTCADTPKDSTNAAGTALVQSWTANSTGGGALIGSGLRFARYWATTLTTQPSLFAWDFGMTPGQCPVLRGVAQVFSVNLNATALGGGQVCQCSATFTEE